MDKAKQVLVQNWLIKAHHDLAASRKLSDESEPYLDVAIYHCQQAAEKAVKGFFVFHDHEFDKTHDVRLLIDIAASIQPTFLDWIEAGAYLTPYATGFRYPDDIMEPDKEEFNQAFELATKFYHFVLSQLPETVHPPT